MECVKVLALSVTDGDAFLAGREVVPVALAARVLERLTATSIAVPEPAVELAAAVANIQRMHTPIACRGLALTARVVRALWCSRGVFHLHCQKCECGTSKELRTWLGAGRLWTRCRRGRGPYWRLSGNSD